MGQARPPTRAAAEAAAKAEMDAGARTPQGAPTGARVPDFLHGPLIQTVVMADRKAGILFTLVSAALLFLFTRVPGALTSVAGVLWLLVVANLVTAAACAFAVIFPRVTASKPDILFWGGIAQYADAAQYRDALARTGEAELAAAKARYCYDLACICARKFRLLKAAMLAAAIGLVLFLVALALTVPTADGGVPPWL